MARLVETAIKSLVDPSRASTYWTLMLNGGHFNRELGSARHFGIIGEVYELAEAIRLSKLTRTFRAHQRSDAPTFTPLLMGACLIAGDFYRKCSNVRDGHVQSNPHGLDVPSGLRQKIPSLQRR